MVIGFAHRGASAQHRDNTLPGFERALELGATGLESDAWLTADGVAVLDHDGVVRQGLHRRPIRTVTRASLPDHMPSLADLYALPGVTGVELSLDVKDPDAVAAILAVAGSHRRRLWLCGADVASLAAWRAGDGDVRLVHSTSLKRLGAAGPSHAEVLAGAGVDALNLREGEWTPELVDACHRAGVVAFGWDAQRPDVVARLVGMGIDGVYSDHVEMMMAALRTA